MKIHPLPIALVVILVLFATVNILANLNYWYWTMRWLDMPMHFTGGAWLAGTAVWFRFYSGRLAGEMRGLFHVLLWGVGVAVCVGVVWEIYEMVVSLAVGKDINAISDTLSDIFFDALGAFLVSVFMWMYSLNNNKIIS